MILQITLGFFVILSLALSYAVYNLLLKQEQLEEWVDDYIDRINEVNTKISFEDKTFPSSRALSNLR